MLRDRVADYIPNLRRYARALTGNRDAADDLVQDTLERAMVKFHLWRPGDLRTWLFSIMHSIFVNQYHARQPVTSQDEAMLEAWSEARGAGPGAHGYAGLGPVIDLERALARLSHEHREVLLLVSLEDMGYREVSKALGIPLGTVMSRFSRARERLAALMDGLDPEAAPAGSAAEVRQADARHADARQGREPGDPPDGGVPTIRLVKH
ncbi:MAG: RNA polymerase sigma factor [Candidatus Protistobacter heckmanni]|nr:RNA polymerase sigma factor [Candidatus Protistobacter heckmanni]